MLIDVMAEVSGKALRLILQDKGIVLDAATADKVTPLLTAAVKREYREIVEMGEGLLILGEGWQHAAVTVGCCNAALEALQQAGVLPT